jgi:hypothetical protein
MIVAKKSVSYLRMSMVEINFGSNISPYIIKYNTHHYCLKMWIEGDRLCLMHKVSKCKTRIKSHGTVIDEYGPVASD